MGRNSRNETQGRESAAKGGSTPYILLVLGIILTGICTNYVTEAGDTRQQIEFSNVVERTVESINGRIEKYIGALRGMAGLYAATPGGQVTPHQFQEFVKRIQVRELYPGIQGIGYARLVRAAEKQAVEAELRSRIPGFHIWPAEPDRDEYVTIIQLEPADDRNAHAIGYDMFSEPVRRAAMELARDSGSEAAAGKVRLVQEIDEHVQAGFLIYLPVYRGGAIPPDLEQRRRELVGFVYAPFRADDLFSGIFAGEQQEDVDLHVYDDGVIDEQHLLHATPSAPDAPPEPGWRPHFSETRRISVAGRAWTLVLNSTPSFEAGVNNEAVAVTLLSGLLISGALFFVTRTHIIARAQAEQSAAQLRQAKDLAESANRAKDQFLAVLSHELRTPLTPVLMIAGAAQDDPQIPQQAKSDFAVILQNIELEARLIDDLLDLTKVGRGKLQLQFEVVDAHRILDAAVKVCSPEQIAAKRLTVQVLHEAADFHVRADPARLQQIIWNLVKNAVKFTPEGGTVRVKTFNMPGFHASRPAIAIEVSDSGVGIEPEFLPRVFDAFEQGETARRRQFGGLGLGLAISKGLVEAHGGTIAARSDGPGRGATFTVTLHTVEAPQPQPAVTPLSVQAPPALGISVLLVEDHLDTNLALSRLLRNLGYHVHSAGSVSDGVRIATANHFDILLSDLGLPDGSGIDLLRQLRSLNGRRPWKAIALTGFGMDEDILRTSEAGFCDHLTKPINFQKLQAALERVMRAE
jgi:signal transduction histidine kinase